MGNCLGAAGEEGSGGSGSGEKEYSWDKRDNSDPSLYTFKNLTGQNVGRKRETVAGQHLVFDNCRDSNIYVFDNCAAVTIDDCENCNIFIGPISASLFIRNCKNCNLMVACQQFRTRDCDDIRALLLCRTRPIIEATTNIQFGCFQASYFGLEGQFGLAGLSVYNNTWWNIHDFTPSDTSVPNWRVGPERPEWLETFFNHVPDDVGITPSIDRTKSVVPFTMGIRELPQDERCFLVFFPPAVNQAKKYIKSLREAKGENVRIVQTRAELQLTPSDIQSLLSPPADKAQPMYDACSKGSVVAIEVHGEDCIQTSKVLTDSLRNAVVFLTTSTEAAMQAAPKFYGFAATAQKV
eukprot:m.89466 g.89466  ORF g.89466 m.89466 type:complete len:351 (-) comp14973_c0_seq4:1343-2395(-)